MSLATLKTNGYNIVNSENISNDNPDTFEIPTKGNRVNVDVGQEVQLTFNYIANDNIKYSERIWVEVTERQKINNKVYYTGLLSNEPFHENTNLNYDYVINFRQQHIVNINKNLEDWTEQEIDTANNILELGNFEYIDKNYNKINIT